MVLHSDIIEYISKYLETILTLIWFLAADLIWNARTSINLVQPYINRTLP